MSVLPAYQLSALGIINALGVGKQQVLENLLAGSAPGMGCSTEWVSDRVIFTAAVVSELPVIPKALAHYNSRNNRFLLAALEQIKEPLGIIINRYGHHRVAVVIGSSTSGILEGEKALYALAETGEVPPNYDYRQQEIGSPGLFVADYLGLDGVAYTLSTACSSSAKVFACARNLLAMDICDAVIVGGSDSLCDLTLNGFSALASMSEECCSPFSVNRDGITIGEGAALFLMEKGSGPISLLGVGESSDAHHISAPHPQGIGAAEAMQLALVDAKLAPEQINYLNLHGTATPLNDAMESIAVNRVLGENTPCSSTKALIGHTLGAAGANEVALCWLLLSQPIANTLLPAQVWDGVDDPALAKINLLREERRLPAGGLCTMMSNSFAFGGSNASVIIGAMRE